MFVGNCYPPPPLVLLKDGAFSVVNNKLIIPPASTKLKGGYTGITLSLCPSVDRIVSALYLQQYSSDPFHICTSYQATSEGVSRVMPVSMPGGGYPQNAGVLVVLVKLQKSYTDIVTSYEAWCFWHNVLGRLAYQMVLIMHHNLLWNFIWDKLIWKSGRSL